MEPLYILKLTLARSVQWHGSELARDAFFERAWAELGGPESDVDLALTGIDEGTVFAEGAHEQGLETESWTIDSAEAPRERDWVGSQQTVQATLYFSTREGSERGLQWARAGFGNSAEASFAVIDVLAAQDWNAQWKAAFRELAQGIGIPPFWRVLPAWPRDSGDTVALPEAGPGEIALLVNPGAGFGTGTHETTQLCLRALGEAGRARPQAQGVERALDFGSGSGILAIALAKLGFEVDAVEIDPLAVDNARENARLNGVEDRIRYAFTLEELGEPQRYSRVVANILRPVLLEFAGELCSRLAPSGAMVLSGLVAGDVGPVRVAYEPLVGGREPVVGELGEWRSVGFSG